MITVSKLIPQGRGLASVLLKRAAGVELDWDTRSKSRFDATDSSGRALGVFLPRGTVVRGGDVLVAEDGSLVRVHAAPQPVMVVRHCPHHGRPSDLTRAAYHLGNRHVALELAPDHLKFEPDPVLRDMLDAMHLIVTEEHAAFEPEGGAYAGADSLAAARSAQGGGHSHGHGHAHGHDHAHHDPAHPDHRHHGHDHGPGHGHGHGHGHQAGGPEHRHDHDHGDDDHRH